MRQNGQGLPESLPWRACPLSEGAWASSARFAGVSGWVSGAALGGTSCTARICSKVPQVRAAGMATWGAAQGAPAFMDPIACSGLAAGTR